MAGAFSDSFVLSGLGLGVEQGFYYTSERVNRVGVCMFFFLVVFFILSTEKFCGGQ